MEFELDDFQEEVGISGISGISSEVTVTTVESILERASLEKGLKTALALDISKKSTGIAYWHNGVLETVQVKPKFSGVSALEVGYRVSDLEVEILSLLNGNLELDLVCVEEAILGSNAKTSSVAYALNYAIDRLVVSGRLKVGRFLRIGNTSWKASLRRLTGVSPIKVGEYSDKLEIIESFKRLGYPLVEEYSNYSTMSGYLRSGVQDRLDAVGLLITTVQDYVLGDKVQVLYKQKKCHISVDLNKLLKKAKYSVSEVTPVATNRLNSWYKGLEKEYKQSVSLLMVVPKLGAFGVKQEFYEVAEQYYILVNLDLVTN